MAKSTLIDVYKFLIDENTKFEDCQNLLETLHLDTEILHKNYFNTSEPFQKIKIFSNSRFDVYLILWKMNYKSGYHDHSNNGCFLKVLSGNLTEYIMMNDGSVDKNILKENQVSFIHNNIGLHSIENKSSDEDSISLHIYSPPNHITKYYKF